MKRLVSREEAIAKARAEGRAEGLREAAEMARGRMTPDDLDRSGVLERLAEELEQMAAGGGKRT